jgi:ethanolamine utilization protein EutQ
MSAQLLTIDDVATWYQYKDRPMFLGSVLDETNSDSLGVGFLRYRSGESNEWVVTYDEVNIVTKGAYTFRTDEGDFTAKAGEILHITKGTRVIYEAPEDAEAVYVTYPHFMPAQLASVHADLLDDFHPAQLTLW